MTDQGEREVIALIAQNKMAELYCDNREGEIMNAGPVSYAIADAILALPRQAAAAHSGEGAGGVPEAIRLLNKIADLVDAEDAAEPLDDAIGYANKALRVLSPPVTEATDDVQAPVERYELQKTYDALLALKIAVEASGKLNGREFVGLGVQVNNALDSAIIALSRSSTGTVEAYELCSTCMGSGYSNHPDSGEVCQNCQGQGATDPKGLPLTSPARLCSCKASQRDGQHMAWCPTISSTGSNTP